MRLFLLLLGYVIMHTAPKHMSSVSTHNSFLRRYNDIINLYSAAAWLRYYWLFLVFIRYHCLLSVNFWVANTYVWKKAISMEVLNIDRCMYHCLRASDGTCSHSIHAHLLLDNALLCLINHVVLCVCIMRGNKQLVKRCVFHLAFIELQSEQDPASEIIMYNSPIQFQDGMYIDYMCQIIEIHFVLVYGCING